MGAPRSKFFEHWEIVFIPQRFIHFATCTRQEIDMNVQVETLETRLRMLEVKIERLEKEILQINSGIEKM